VVPGISKSKQRQTSKPAIQMTQPDSKRSQSKFNVSEGSGRPQVGAFQHNADQPILQSSD
jgi:hypothetical protein